VGDSHGAKPHLDTKTVAAERYAIRCAFTGRALNNDFVPLSILHFVL